MKICLINGSPKGGKSASELLCWTLECQSGLEGNDLETGDRDPLDGACGGSSIETVRVNGGWRTKPADHLWKAVERAERIVLVFPLYVDGIPSHLLEFLECWERRRRERGMDVAAGMVEVYAVVNCGFYEGTQNRNALAMVRHFCRHAGFRYGGGIGIGGGPLVCDNPSGTWDSSIRRDAGQALAELARRLLREEEPSERAVSGTAEPGSKTTEESGLDAQECRDCYVSPGIPRCFYMMGGNLNWLFSARENRCGFGRLFHRRTWPE